MSISMTRWNVVALFIFTIIGSATLFGARAEALSTQWSSGLPNLCGVGTNSCPSGSGWVSFFNVQASVTYNAEVVNTDTGEVIACGSEVPTRTNIQFRFVPHVYSDISWFASGRGFDSPYGDWSPAGANPPTNPCDGKYSIGRTGGGAGYGTAFGTLAVNPPPKTVSGLPSECTKADDGASMDCVFTQAGEVTASFDFAATYAYMYSALRPEGGKKLEGQYYNKCLGRTIMGTNASAPYQVPIPAKSISCPITIVTNNETPSAPTVTVQNNSACVVGQPHTLIMTATDPKNDSVRYGIDWDANGTVDEFMPPTGYVPSGTSQTASRTYATAGSKRVKVLAQNSQGLTSGWTTATFSCAAAAAAADDATAALDTFQTSMGASGIADDGSVAGPTMDLRAIPSLVKRGTRTRIHWTTTNVRSCIVTAPNGDSWNAVLSDIGGQLSKPITQTTKYTLTCVDLNDLTRSRSTTVRIAPTFREI